MGGIYFLQEVYAIGVFLPNHRRKMLDLSRYCILFLQFGCIQWFYFNAKFYVHDY